MLKFLHRFGAVLILSFVLVHLTHHIVALAGADAHRAFSDLLRPIYRHQFIEPALLGFFALQATTGIGLAMASARRLEARSLASWIELISAFYFLIFISVHLAAVFFTRLHLYGQTDYYWVTDLFAASPLQPVVIGFHVLGAISVAVHAGVGLRYFFQGLGAANVDRAVMSMMTAFGLLAGVVAAFAYGGA